MVNIWGNFIYSLSSTTKRPNCSKVPVFILLHLKLKKNTYFLGQSHFRKNSVQWWSKALPVLRYKNPLTATYCTLLHLIPQHFSSQDLTAPVCTSLHIIALHCISQQPSGTHITTLNLTAPHCTSLHLTAPHCTSMMKVY